jgi:lipoprotein-anchoring transpeptidase ErfK/SrfK
VLALTSCANLPRDCFSTLYVSVPDQKMELRQHDVRVTVYPISTSKFGLGDQPGSNCTPLGELEVAQKIGAGQPSGMKFKSRRPTGEIVPPDAPGRDPIVSRILWLRGLETCNANAYQRYIYIHGTPQESLLGQPKSYGCIRMRSSDIIDLFDRVGSGAKVKILTHPLAELPPPAAPPIASAGIGQ